MRMTTGLLAAGLLCAWFAGPQALLAQPEREDEPGMEQGGGPEGGPEEMEGRMPPGGPMGQRGGGGGAPGRMGMGRPPEGGPRGEGGMGPGRGRGREFPDDPEVQKVMRQNEEARQAVHKLIREYRKEKDAKKQEAIKGELKKALDAAFDASLAAQTLRLKKMEEELGKLKERINKRRGMKQKLIEKKLGELSGEEEGFDW